VKGLGRGDAITAVDGVPTPSESRAVGLIRTHKPGQRVTLSIQRVDGARTTASVVLGHLPHHPQVPFVGVGIVTGPYFQFPFQVGVNSDGIGGPSAGLAFTLGILNRLGGGDLTGGHRVAATGTISANGKVGLVGGVPQKTIAVRQAGATVFLVPPGNYHQALSKADGHLKVVPVSTLTQALAALRRLGAHIPPPSSAPR
jgi:PDZ domain-containing protein